MSNITTAFKMTYPGKEAYNFPKTLKHTSPCMDPYWRSQPIRQGQTRDEHDFELKQDEEEKTEMI